ncbi:MAG: 16S rRNA (cytosine(1402)-N(4))-methyltransferase RsmH [Pseudomonadales bacterium]|nr:16S rRNA (cytosine(1402)-N(4))-methyltransferase RsmH [Pseudomonadales bacterium]
MHISVLLHEAIEFLNVQSGSWYIDGTFGRGGHTKAILKAGGNVIAFDWDHEAIAYGRETFAHEIIDGRLILVHESFSKIEQSVRALRIETEKDLEISGALFDFGTSTEQLTSANRGFSFEGDGELDMRMDTRLGVMAKDILALIPENQLADLFKDFGGEEESKAIAKAVKQAKTPVSTTKQLADIVAKVKRHTRPGINPATKVFQALRIAVNSELDEISDALPSAFSVLNPAGTLVCISFHDGEDRLVKQQFKAFEKNKLAEVLTPKPLQPTEKEITENYRSRSAKLRALRKL